MPPLPFAPNCLKVRHIGTIGPGEFGMIHHFRHSHAGDVTDVEASTIATDFSTNWNTNIVGLFSNQVILKQVVVEGLNSGTDGEGAWGGAIPGTGAAGTMSAAVAVLEKDTIGRRYRGGHPRHYWPAPSEGNLADPTHLTDAYVAFFQAQLDAWVGQALVDIGTVLTGTADFVNVSYYTAHALRPVPVIDSITGWSIEKMVATQRRRVGR